jgi:hypothetical protein
MSNPLNVEVSYFRNCTDTEHPVTVNLQTYLNSSKHRASVEKIRQTQDKATRDRLKRELLPGITPSGVFTKRSENFLVRHSGLIAGDIDFKDNPYEPQLLKKQIAKLRNIAYCGLSASGLGLWFLAPISEPVHHKEHFAALVIDFMRFGIRLDPAPANVASFRYYSFDPEPYLNLAAVPYQKQHWPKAETYVSTTKPNFGYNEDQYTKLDSLVRQIEQRHLDLTANYSDWFAVGCALASELGENGRSYFHRLSQFYTGYKQSETDKQFTACLRMRGNRFGLGTLYYLANRHGIKSRSVLQTEQIFLQKPSVSGYALPPGWVRTHQQNIYGDEFELVLDEDGLPATWGNGNLRQGL